MKLSQAISLSFILALPHQGIANPTDSGSNNMLNIKSLYVRHMPYLGISEVAAYFDATFDGTPAQKLANYGLKELFPALAVGGNQQVAAVLEDLDGDADLDLVVSLRNGDVVAHRNVGSAKLPRFDSESTVIAHVGKLGEGGYPLGYCPSVKFHELNGDDKRDMVCGEGESGEISCFVRSLPKNQWPSQSAYAAQAKVVTRAAAGDPPLHIKLRSGGAPCIAFQDLDGDLKEDLIVGEDDIAPPGPDWLTRWRLYRATGEIYQGMPVFRPYTHIQAEGEPLLTPWRYDGPSCPVFMDADGDLDKDLIISNTYGTIQVIENDGVVTDENSPSLGSVKYLTPRDLLDSSERVMDLGWVASLQVVDYAGDGDLDLFFAGGERVNHELGYAGTLRMRVMENHGAGVPSFSAPGDLVGLSGQRVALTDASAAFDFDADGKIDLLSIEEGKLLVSYNMDTGNTHNPEYSDSIAVKEGLGLPISAEVVDFNMNGTLDPLVDGLLVTNQTQLEFSRFMGRDSAGKLVFGDTEALILPGNAGREGFARVSLGDIDKNGTLDLLLQANFINFGLPPSGEELSLQLYKNQSSSSFQLTHAGHLPIDGQQIDYHMCHEFFDFDRDGDLDLVASCRNQSNGYSGSIYAYKNVNGSFASDGILKTSSGMPVAAQQPYWLSPIVVDFDRDGKSDLIVSTEGGLRSYLTSRDAPVGICALKDVESNLNMSATLPGEVSVDTAGRKLVFRYSARVPAGSGFDFNEMYVNGIRCAILGKTMRNYHEDLDVDVMADGWEAEHAGAAGGGGPGGLDPSTDGDVDGLINVHEYQEGTNPKYPDHPAVQLRFTISAQ